MQGSLFSEVFKSAPVGLVILDKAARIAHINSFALSCFSLPRKDYKGYSFGRALGCAAVHGSNSRCGDMDSCQECRFLESFSTAISHGLRIRQAIVSHTFVIDGAPVVKTFQFSAGPADLKKGRHALLSFADITQEKLYEALLKRDLDLDGAPGMISRHNLIGIVAGLMRQAEPDSSISVGMVHLNGLNCLDCASDEVLRRFTEIARQCTRRQDIIGRCNTSDFMLIFPGAGIHMAATIAKRIHDTMDAVFAAQGVGGISFSAGFTAIKAGQIPTLTGDDITRAVIDCLQKAQQSGRSLFVSHELTALLRN